MDPVIVTSSPFTTRTVPPTSISIWPVTIIWAVALSMMSVAPFMTVRVTPSSMTSCPMMVVVVLGLRLSVSMMSTVCI